MSQEVKLKPIAHSMGPYLNTAKNSSVGATNAMPLSSIRRKCRRHHGRTRLRARLNRRQKPNSTSTRTHDVAAV
jgi:hypothetical protein